MVTTEPVTDLNILVHAASNLLKPAALLNSPWPATILPVGGVVELSGLNNRLWFVNFLNCNPELSFFWAHQDHSAVTLRQLIQSRRYDVILSPRLPLDIKTIQALKVFCAQTKCTLFLISTGL